MHRPCGHRAVGGLAPVHRPCGHRAVGGLPGGEEALRQHVQAAGGETTGLRGSAHPLAPKVWVKELESSVLVVPMMPAAPTPAVGVQGQVGECFSRAARSARGHAADGGALCAARRRPMPPTFNLGLATLRGAINVGRARGTDAQPAGAGQCSAGMQPPHAVNLPRAAAAFFSPHWATSHVPPPSAAASVVAEESRRNRAELQGQFSKGKA